MRRHEVEVGVFSSIKTASLAIGIVGADKSLGLSFVPPVDSDTPQSEEVAQESETKEDVSAFSLVITDRAILEFVIAHLVEGLNFYGISHF